MTSLQDDTRSPDQAPPPGAVTAAPPPSAAAEPWRRRQGLLPILRFVGRRVLLGIAIAIVISILVFAATQALPGDAAVVRLGHAATPQALADFRARFHLNESIVHQYLSWAGDLLRGRLGTSLSSNTSVSSLIGSRLSNSLVLLLTAAVLGVPTAVAIGIVSARLRDSAFDHVTSGVLLVVAALPEFVIGVCLTLLLSTTVAHVFPAASLVNPNESIFDQLYYIWLPAITLALAIIPYVARITRASMIEALESDYVAMARLKGLSERRVLIRYAFPNASGPTFQAIALMLAYLFGGVVVVETVFQFPGIGLELITSIQNRDLPVIQVLVLLITVVYLVVSIVADTLTMLMTPRLRTMMK